MTATSKTDQQTDNETTEDGPADDAAGGPEVLEKTSGAEGADSDTDDTDDTDGTDEADDAYDDGDDEFAVPAARAASGVATGAAAITGAALGLASLTGTWLGDLMSARREVIGQLNSQSAAPAEQIEAIYGTPWHTIALFNGVVALVAIFVTGFVLVRPAFAQNAARPVVWVRAVAVAGLVLGALGLLVAGVMWFDLFTDLPTVPGQ